MITGRRAAAETGEALVSEAIDQESFTTWPQSMTYPGDNNVDNRAQARCDAAFLKYDGMDSADSNFSYDYLIPDDTTWPSGDRFVVCVAYA